MVNEGALIVDVGGESTRPGSKLINAKKEWKRIEKTIKTLKKNFPGLVFSLDTRKAYVMEKGIEQGVNIINYVSGLNPHAGENGKVGKEEKKIITPAINKLKKEKINVFGPISPDIIFQHDIRKKYDVAVCMYHDQALIPIKVLSFNNIVNITLGLDFIRTSPDHGTALDIAGLNKANANSMIEAIKKAEQLIHNKRP